MWLCCGVKTNQRQQILAHDHQTQSKLSVCLLQGWLRPGNPRSPEAKSCLPSFSLRERGGGGDFGRWLPHILSSSVTDSHPLPAPIQ